MRNAKSILVIKVEEFDPMLGVKWSIGGQAPQRIKIKLKNTYLSLANLSSVKWKLAMFDIYGFWPPHLTLAQGSNFKMGVKRPWAQNQTQTYLSVANLSWVQLKLAIWDIYGFWPPIWPQHRGQMSKWGSNTLGLKTKLKNMYLLRIWAQYNENWPF